MTLNLEQWQYPMGRYQPKQDFSSEEIKASIATLKAFPTELKELLSQCSEKTLINLIVQVGGPLSN